MCPGEYDAAEDTLASLIFSPGSAKMAPGGLEPGGGDGGGGVGTGGGRGLAVVDGKGSGGGGRVGGVEVAAQGMQGLVGVREGVPAEVLRLYGWLLYTKRGQTAAGSRWLATAAAAPGVLLCCCRCSCVSCYYSSYY